MKAIFDTLTHGVYVITTRSGKQRGGFTAAWLTQVSFTPPLLAFSINPQHYSYGLLQASGVCTVNVLSCQQLPIAQLFGKRRGAAKLADVAWYEQAGSAPILAGALAYFHCTVSHKTQAGDHELLVCQVINAALLQQGQPLSYADTGDMDGSSVLQQRLPVTELTRIV